MRIVKYILIIVFILILFFVFAIQMGIWNNESETKYYYANEYFFSGKVANFYPVDKRGYSRMVAVELKLDSLKIVKKGESNCILGKMDSTKDVIIFQDYFFRGYGNNEFDSISINSRLKEIVYFKKGNVIKKEEIRLSCRGETSHKKFKRLLDKKLGEGVIIF